MYCRLRKKNIKEKGSNQFEDKNTLRNCTLNVMKSKISITFLKAILDKVF